jgi:hypothetical protein
MANELTITATLALAKGGLKASAAKSGLKRDMTGDQYLRATQVVGTVAEPLAVAEVNALGYLHLENLSAEATVHLRAGSGGANLISLAPGDVAVCRLATACDPHLIASAAGAQVQLLLVEA